MIRLSILLMMSMLAFCKIGQNALRNNKPMVELKTGGCYGYCPIIRLTVRNNGLVEYEGQLFAERQGLDSFQLTAAELRQLRKKVKATKLWSYPDKIKSNVVDAPSATLTVFKSGKTKSVIGTIDRPAPLLELESLIKNLAEAHDFQVTQGVNPKEPPVATRKEVIVKLQPELNAGNWMRQFSDYRFILVRRIASENIWLLAYDPAEIDEKSIIALFKKTEGVLEAQPNRKTEERD